VGGKTTNLQVLHSNAVLARRGEMVSVHSAQDRTILFDLLPLKAPGLRGFDLRLQLLAVPGQAMYAATRRLVLKGADAVVFVANSAADRWEENVQSFREMTENLLSNQLDPAALPLVLQYNKRDLPEVTPYDFMDRTLNARKVESFSAVAVRGEGVLETFSAILASASQDVARRYHILDAGGGSALQDWVEHATTHLFGTTTLAAVGGPANEAVPEVHHGPAESSTTERRTIRLEMPEDRAALRPDARANETLVDRYAVAATKLATDLDTMREERDLARRRLEDLRLGLGAADEVLAGRPVPAALQAALAPMATAAGTSQASFLTPRIDGVLHPVVLRGLAEDPLLRHPKGTRYAAERLTLERVPRVHHAADSLDLGEALGAASPAFGAVTVVPVRSARALQGLALLYHAPDDVLPGSPEIQSLATLGHSLSATLELASALEVARTADRTLSMALLGTASLQGIEDALSSLLLVRDRLAQMRRREGAPSWFQEEYARLSPFLALALSTGRSLLAFNRGELERAVVDLEGLFEELRGNGVDVQVAAGATTVRGDAVLVRLAVLALIENARASSSKARPQFVAVRDGGAVKIRVASGLPSSPEDELQARFAGPNLRLAFAQRIAQLHGGRLGREMDRANVVWATLTVPVA
jgi:hypothetical protein